MSGFRGESRFETWLYRLATTTYLKERRSAATAKRRGRELAADEVPESAAPLVSPPAPLDGLIGEDRRRLRRAAVAELPERMRRCVTLRIYHEMSYREIGTVLAIEADTVKAHLFQARKKLREAMPEERFGELAAGAGADERRGGGDHA